MIQSKELALAGVCSVISVRQCNKGSRVVICSQKIPNRKIMNVMWNLIEGNIEI